MIYHWSPHDQKSHLHALTPYLQNAHHGILGLKLVATLPCVYTCKRCLKASTLYLATQVKNLFSQQIAEDYDAPIPSISSFTFDQGVIVSIHTDPGRLQWPIHHQSMFFPHANSNRNAL